MKNFVFENPTKIIFGKGSIAKIGQEVKKFGSRVLLVYGKGSIVKNGIYKQVMDALKAAEVDAVDFPGVKSNPVLSLVYEGIAVAHKERVEAVLAVGGGSVIDTAKAIAAGSLAEEDVWDYFSKRIVVEKSLPVLTVLTVSASASEMNPVAVITNEKTAQKFSIRSLHIQPRVSILDPTTLFTLTPEYTAYSAVDAVVHMLEGYLNNSEPDSPLQDRLVEGLIMTIMEKTHIALKSPDAYEARANLMWATTLAFNGLTTAGMGQVGLPVHMMGHSLSALFDVPHGASLSIVLPAWMNYAVGKNPQKLARFAREIFKIGETDDFKAACSGIQHLRTWMSSIGSPVRLQQYGIPGDDLARVVDNACGTAEAWGLKEYSREIIANIFNDAQ